MRRFTPEQTFLAGKIVFNIGQSSLDRVVRRMSEEGTTLQLETGLGGFSLFPRERHSRRFLLSLAWRRGFAASRRVFASELCSSGPPS
ncbi:hypothetical protein LQG66_17665 [Bradyrhizobium ontarionense]|uniref:Uncharacterized protein n=1 Tax=Bradyrhizobium ontarionense TaxID=2898149 RepID=A0ABY3RND0_9BRAD|nr:hypothetical protein [Bradyrhizobium sp. A19]UFZ08009.1 hypothetical protein LQG66_17665 [Bradyrhizobium sp. A19]